MPPRLGALQRLATLKLFTPRPAARLLPMVQAASLSRKEKVRKLRRMDPYRREQMEQRKAAHLKRREEIDEQRAIEWGDPIWGSATPTPFLESFASAGQQAQIVVPKKEEDAESDGDGAAPATGARKEAIVRAIGDKDSSSSKSSNGTDKAISESNSESEAEDSAPTEVRDLPTSFHLRNYLVTGEELDKALQHAYVITKPKERAIGDVLDPLPPQRSHEENHERAKIAMQRIMAVDNGSAKNKFHVNVQRILEEFGRHETDKFLTQKPVGVTKPPEKVPRAGPDTGSSEVQIAILTLKIRKLATELKSEANRKDIHNKANLRKLVHQRQKMLQYMLRKERGSGRWTHMIEKLGLTPATWEGQITI
ncbi:hypothetical protein CP533_0745 [Ophiocordyceps camponoti-saundersi (nom. inval.)]|nr:hypothetical protein CP533_0745 [Ophiocordyceps camponoti-saundersi (nom. inval.)]